jgi:ribosomal protein S12 methylthiotransferase
MTKRAQNTYYLASLGCAKNLVDSESMAELLNRQGLDPVISADQAEYLIVNTCGFLHSAREEAIAVLTDLASEKLPWQKLIVAGCMTEHHRQEILDYVPGVDGLLGTRRWMDILEVIDQLENREPQDLPYAHFPAAETVGQEEKGTHRAAVQGGSAYLKIADGCRRACAYCMIPLIKGTLVSRPVEKIIQDAKVLRDRGVKEIILIAQDTTDYGHDLGMKEGLTHLLESLVKAVPDLPWIRLMYTFPGYVSDRLIELMAAEPQILPYLDMPLQHADPKILKAMGRPSNIHNVRQTLSKVRDAMPDVALRTTFIVGYPGESDASFKTLVNFVQTVRFDHVGVFTYSFEPGTPAEPLEDPIPNPIKNERLERLMTVQAEISLERNQKFIGRTMDVLIEGIDEENQIAIGRSYRDAPEIDGLVVIEGLAPVGEIVPVQINSAITHDLVGTLVQNNEVD